MPEFMSGTVDVPVAGKIKKKYVLIPAGIALAYVTYRWYLASQEPAPDPTADGIYSSEDLSEYGLSTSGGATNVTGNTGSVVTDGTNPNAIDTNAAWSQKATELLTNMGYDPMTVGNALGAFLARQSLDKAEATIARAALAQVGQPPQNGPYSVIEEAGAGTGTLPAPANLRRSIPPLADRIYLKWDPVPGAAWYWIYRSDMGQAEAAGISSDTVHTANGLKPNTSYSFTVVAVNSLGKKGPASNTFTDRTAQVKLSAPTGLRASAITRTSFRVTANAVKGADYYRWYYDGKETGGVTDRPYRDFTGMSPNKSYRITARADNAQQSAGPVSAPLTVRTKK